MSRVYDISSIAKNGPGQFKFFSPEDKKSKEVCLQVVSINGNALRHMPNFQDDKEIVYAAVKSKGHAYQFASKELKKDPELLLIALDTNRWVREKCCPSLLNDKRIAQKIVEKYNDYHSIGDKAKEDKSLFLLHIQKTKEDFRKYYAHAGFDAVTFLKQPSVEMKLMFEPLVKAFQEKEKRAENVYRSSTIAQHFSLLDEAAAVLKVAIEREALNANTPVITKEQQKPTMRMKI